MKDVYGRDEEWLVAPVVVKALDLKSNGHFLSGANPAACNVCADKRW